MNESRQFKQNQRGSWGLIGTLIAVAILVIVFIFLIYPKIDLLSTYRGKEGKSMPQAAIEESKGVECASNLRQIRQGLIMYKSERDSYPPSLMDLKLGVGPNFFKCPVGKMDYYYDPNTGIVKCPYPDHQGF